MTGAYRKTVFCAGLESGDVVDEVFCVGRVERRTKGDGSAYLRLALVDRTGEVAGVAWDDVDALTEVLVEGGYARVRGDVGEFRGDIQVKVTDAAPVEGSIDPSEYLPEGPVPAAESVAGIRSLVDRMGDPWLKRLLLSFLEDPDFARAFAGSPAAMRNHHAYVGGLAEHTRSVMELCAKAADHYPGVDRDLLLAGAFCHDIGKVAELAVEPGFPYTEEGQLLGHIPIGFAMVRERAAAIDGFPADRRTDLGHLVLSHQGELEWGSPVVPRLLEAIVLHFVDNLDSKVATARKHLEEVDSGRTGWVHALGRTLYRRGPAEESGEKPEASDALPEPPARTGGGPDEGERTGATDASAARPSGDPPGADRPGADRRTSDRVAPEESPSLFDELD